MNEAFSAWQSWGKREALTGLTFPGVYLLAISPITIAGVAFSWRPEVIYVGMTNARGGLKSRLKQFDDTIRFAASNHGGGERVRFKHRDYAQLCPQLYVSVRSWECDVTSNKPADLRIMGEVEKQEYECQALFVEAFGALPEFNDKKRSPKK
jgi:hypothetical protein